MFVVREQTVSNSSVGGKSQPLARATKWLRDARDETDLSLTVRERKTFCRRRTVGIDGLERPACRYLFEYLFSGHELRVIPLALCVERHEFDEAYDATRLARERSEVQDLVVVLSPQYDHVQFQRRQSRGFGNVHCFKDGSENAPTTNRVEPLWFQRIATDVDSL